jgi:hypothetical protein
VSGANPGHDRWRIPALALWIVFFLIGLAPEYVYLWLREVAGVLPQRAIVNSHHLITLGLACYIGLFGYHRCIDGGLSPREAQDRGLQLTVVGLVAFLSVDFRLLVSAYMAPLFQHRLTTYFLAISKLVAWWSLLTLMIRYYALQDDRVFPAIPSLFPSARRGERAAAHDTQSAEEPRRAEHDSEETDCEQGEDESR